MSTETHARVCPTCGRLVVFPVSGLSPRHHLGVEHAPRCPACGPVSRWSIRDTRTGLIVGHADLEGGHLRGGIAERAS
jgi:endogenous inhibitor of DNA gyrase (YacG/DUF329 family)